MVFPDEEEQYPGIIPPIIKPFELMTQKEAETYLNWWIAETPKRIELLTRMYVNTGGKKEDLDYSPESLKKLWAWFIPFCKRQKKRKEDIDTEKSSIPPHMRGDVLISEEELHFASFRIAIDIAFYFSEVFLKNNSNLHWGLCTKPKNNVHYHKPIIIGFEKTVNLQPTHVVRILASKVTDGDKNPMALFDLYNVWKKFI
jgi:hypothetical protein